jgi:hypothetical protein
MTEEITEKDQIDKPHGHHIMQMMNEVEQVGEEEEQEQEEEVVSPIFSKVLEFRWRILAEKFYLQHLNGIISKRIGDNMLFILYMEIKNVV